MELGDCYYKNDDDDQVKVEQQPTMTTTTTTFCCFVSITKWLEQQITVGVSVALLVVLVCVSHSAGAITGLVSRAASIVSSLVQPFQPERLSTVSSSRLY